MRKRIEIEDVREREAVTYWRPGCTRQVAVTLHFTIKMPKIYSE